MATAKHVREKAISLQEMKHIERQEGIPTRAQVVRKAGQIDVIGRIDSALIVLYTVMSLHNHGIPNEGPKWDILKGLGSQHTGVAGRVAREPTSPPPFLVLFSKIQTDKRP